MPQPTTVSVTARADMQDEMQGFLLNKSLPGARVRLGDQWQEHQFTRSGEEHRFTITTDLDTPQGTVSLEFMDDSEAQGAIEITSLHVNGWPMGISIYQCEYTPNRSGETLKSHLYLGWPGKWQLTLGPDDFRYAGFRFV